MLLYVIFNIVLFDSTQNCYLTGPIFYHIYKIVISLICNRIIFRHNSFNVKEYTDTEIIRCLKERQSDVVRYLFNRYMPMIRLMVIQMGGSVEDAKDLFQDGLIIMLEKIDKDELVLRCKFKTFLYSVCENLWKAVLAKRRIAENYFNRRMDTTIEKDFTEIYDNELYHNIFEDVYNTLDQVSRKILTLYWQDFSPKEIAVKLGYTYGYVRKKKSESQGELIRKLLCHPQYVAIRKTEEATKNIVYD